MVTPNSNNANAVPLRSFLFKFSANFWQQRLPVWCKLQIHTKRNQKSRILCSPLEMNRLATINTLKMVAVVMDLQKPQHMSCDRHSPFGTCVAEIICQHIAVELIRSIPQCMVAIALLNRLGHRLRLRQKEAYALTAELFHTSSSQWYHMISPTQGHDY